MSPSGSSIDLEVHTELGERVEVHEVQRADVAGHDGFDTVRLGGRDCGGRVLDEETDVVCARAVFGQEVVGEPLAVDRLQELDLHPAAAAERERDRRLDVATAVPVGRTDRRKRRPVLAARVLA